MWKEREAQWNKRLQTRRLSWPQSNDEWISLAIVYSLKLEEPENTETLKDENFDIWKDTVPEEDNRKERKEEKKEEKRREERKREEKRREERRREEKERRKRGREKKRDVEETEEKEEELEEVEEPTKENGFEERKRVVLELEEDPIQKLWVPHKVPIELLMPSSYPFSTPLSEFIPLVEENYAVPLNTDDEGTVLSSTFASALYAILDSPQVPDSFFKAFLWSFDQFVCPAHLLQIIILFYRLQNDIDASPPQDGQEPIVIKKAKTKPKVQILQPQIGPINLLIEMIMLFYSRLKEDRMWNHYFTKFLEYLELFDDSMQSKRLTKAWAYQEQRHKQVETLLANVSFEYEPTSLSILDFSVADMAHQITYNTQIMVQVISIDEYRFWTKARKHRVVLCPNLNVLVEWFNDFSHWVATSIITAGSTLKEKATIIVYWIRVMDEVCAMKNFEGMMPIFLALQLQPISALKEVWKIVPKKFVTAYNKAGDLLSQAQNFRNYRHLLAETNRLQPHIPIHAVIMKDITIIEELPTFHKGEINWVKLATYGEILGGVRISRNSLYSFDNFPEVQKLIIHGINTCLSLEQLYEVSDQVVKGRLRTRNSPPNSSRTMTTDTETSSGSLSRIPNREKRNERTSIDTVTTDSTEEEKGAKDEKKAQDGRGSLKLKGFSRRESLEDKFAEQTTPRKKEEQRKKRDSMSPSSTARFTPIKELPIDPVGDATRRKPAWKLLSSGKNSRKNSKPEEVTRISLDQQEQLMSLQRQVELLKLAHLQLQEQQKQEKQEPSREKSHSRREHRDHDRKDKDHDKRELHEETKRVASKTNSHSDNTTERERITRSTSEHSPRPTASSSPSSLVSSSSSSSTRGNTPRKMERTKSNSRSRSTLSHAQTETETPRTDISSLPLSHNQPDVPGIPGIPGTPEEICVHIPGSGVRFPPTFPVLSSPRIKAKRLAMRVSIQEIPFSLGDEDCGPHEHLKASESDPSEPANPSRSGENRLSSESELRLMVTDFEVRNIPGCYAHSRHRSQTDELTRKRVLSVREQSQSRSSSVSTNSTTPRETFIRLGVPQLGLANTFQENSESNESIEGVSRKGSATGTTSTSAGCTPRIRSPRPGSIASVEPNANDHSPRSPRGVACTSNRIRLTSNPKNFSQAPKPSNDRLSSGLCSTQSDPALRAREQWAPASASSESSRISSSYSDPSLTMSEERI
eukprot:TRINITY_DN5567_c0_g1_i1.p1 TRINITY_DN5567_c0_g1~~TRINITY_DN5567_c0_g1_i1.p1  ORF type:complete len:1205 (+),score=266.83 TRINITY_DN5567_c0_g1_i1:78-3692(+)